MNIGYILTVSQKLLDGNTTTLRGDVSELGTQQYVCVERCAQNKMSFDDLEITERKCS